jgi:hypothetical protein
MIYRTLAVGLDDTLFSDIQNLLAAQNVYVTPTVTAKDAGRLMNREIFHLLIVDLKYLKSIGQIDWLTGIRRITFIQTGYRTGYRFIAKCVETCDICESNVSKL